MRLHSGYIFIKLSTIMSMQVIHGQINTIISEVKLLIIIESKTSLVMMKKIPEL